MGHKEELDWTCCKGRWSDEIGARRENGRKGIKGRPRMGMIEDVLDEAKNRELENYETKDLPLGRELIMMMTF